MKTIQLDAELERKESKNGKGYWVGKTQKNLRFTDNAILEPPVASISRFLENTEAMFGSLDTIKMVEYAITLVKRRLGTAKEVIDE